MTRDDLNKTQKEKKKTLADLYYDHKAKIDSYSIIILGIIVFFSIFIVFDIANMIVIAIEGTNNQSMLIIYMLIYVGFLLSLVLVLSYIFGFFLNIVLQTLLEVIFSYLYSRSNSK